LVTKLDLRKRVVNSIWKSCFCRWKVGSFRLENKT
jgi:hypothetical protein